jgi:hypothetical protein
MKENLHVQAIPQDILTQAQIKINEVKTLLAPYLLALTPAERQGMPKMGKKTIGFVKITYDFAKQNLNLVLPYLEMTAFGMNFTDAHGLWLLHNLVRKWPPEAKIPCHPRVLQVRQDSGGAGHTGRESGL